MGNAKILTCETWVKEKSWFEYATSKEQGKLVVPYVLADRSMCQDPFLDPYEQCIESAIPVISGCCRYLSNSLEVGDILIYIANINKNVAMMITKSDTVPSSLKENLNNNKIKAIYFGVALLRVKEIISSHQEAAKKFTKRKYIDMQKLTTHPPNLSHCPTSCAAVPIKSSITYTEKENKQEIVQYVSVDPGNATKDQYNKNYSWYHARQKPGESKKRAKDGLKVALCEFVIKNPINGFKNPCCPRHLNITKTTPVITSEDLDGRKVNVSGLTLNPEQLGKIITKF